MTLKMKLLHKGELYTLQKMIKKKFLNPGAIRKHGQPPLDLISDALVFVVFNGEEEAEGEGLEEVSAPPPGRGRHPAGRS